MTTTTTISPSTTPAWVAMGLDHQTWATLVICEQNSARHREQAERYSNLLAQARLDPRTTLHTLDRLQSYVVENFKEAQWWDARAAKVCSESYPIMTAAE